MQYLPPQLIAGSTLLA